MNQSNSSSPRKTPRVIEDKAMSHPPRSLNHATPHRHIGIIKSTHPSLKTPLEQNNQDKILPCSDSPLIDTEFWKEVNESSKKAPRNPHETTNTMLFGHVSENVSQEKNQVKVEEYNSISTCLKKKNLISLAQVVDMEHPRADDLSFLKNYETMKPSLSSRLYKGQKSIDSISAENSVEQVSRSMLSMINCIKYDEPDDFSLQKTIDAAAPFSTILLPARPIHAKSLKIKNPLLIQGQIGTSLHISETINVCMSHRDFFSNLKSKVKFLELKILFIGKEPEWLTSIEKPPKEKKGTKQEPERLTLFFVDRFTRLEIENCLIESHLHSNMEQNNFLKTLGKVNEKLQINKDIEEISLEKESRDLEEDRFYTLAFKIAEYPTEKSIGKLTICSSIVKNFSSFLFSRSEFDFLLKDTHFEESTDHGFILRDPSSFLMKNAHFVHSGKNAIELIFSQTSAVSEKKSRKIHVEKVFFVYGAGSALSISSCTSSIIAVEIGVYSCVFVKFEEDAILIRNFQGRKIKIVNNEIKTNSGYGVHFLNVTAEREDSFPSLVLNRIYKNTAKGGFFAENSFFKFEKNELYENKEGIRITNSLNGGLEDLSNSKKQGSLLINMNSQIEGGSMLAGARYLQSNETKYEEEICLSSLSTKNKEPPKKFIFKCLLQGNDVYSNTGPGMILDLKAPTSLIVKSCLFSQNLVGIRLSEDKSCLFWSFLSSPKFSKASGSSNQSEAMLSIHLIGCSIVSNLSYGLFIETICSNLKQTNMTYSKNEEGAIFVAEKGFLEKLKTGSDSFYRGSSSIEFKGPWGKITNSTSSKKCIPCDFKCRIF